MKAPTIAFATGGSSIFMSYKGIDGEVTAEGFDKYIELNSFQWGVGRTISNPSEGQGLRERGSPVFSEITITRAMDNTSPDLVRETLVGDPKDVKIYFVNSSAKGKPKAYAGYELKNVLISAYSVSSGGDQPSESLSLNFTKLEFIYYQPDAHGKTKPNKVAWDLTKGAPA